MRRPTSRLRGLGLRTLGALIGLVVAGSGVAGLQLAQFKNQPVSVVLDAPRMPASPNELIWPSVGSAAVSIPALGVTARSDLSNNPVPIASLTKMMTAYVVLRHSPLTSTEVGPCHTVTATDVAVYDHMAEVGESSIAVAEGESLCERDLLAGALIHSGGNFAVMLSQMVTPSRHAFVEMMNQTAHSLGMDHTHYADVDGISPQSRSTASDQLRIATALMTFSVVRQLVLQPFVTLPVAGTLNSFTPLVGSDNVIGIKSGRTDQAGGCDALDMTATVGGKTYDVIAVVLGQRGGDLITPAGAAALAAATSLVADARPLTVPASRLIGSERIWHGRVEFSLGRTHHLWWFPGTEGALAPTVKMSRLSHAVHPGDVLGTIRFAGTTQSGAWVLRARTSLSPPSLFQRLR